MEWFPAFWQQPLWYAGLIWALTMGWAASSYASAFAYRLPRGELTFKREPYCGDCNASLQPKDLFPIFSYAMTLGRCRYCQAKIPATYFGFELFYTLYVCVLYVLYSFSDHMILLAVLGFLLQLNVMMRLDDRYSSASVISLIMGTGVAHQLMQGQTLVDAFFAIFMSFMFAMFVHSLVTRSAPQKNVYAISPVIWLTAASGAWLLNLPLAVSFFVIWALLTLLMKFLFLRQLSVADALTVANMPSLLGVVIANLL